MTTKNKNKNSVINTPKQIIYIVAGEASGDQIGASVIDNLLKINQKTLQPGTSQPDSLQIEGIGGAEMSKKGLKSLFPMRELSIMGLVEILPHALNVMSRLNQTIEDIKRLKPNVVVTIDAPGFNFRLAKRIKSLNIPVIHINAPTVWAWRPRRAEKIAGYITHLLTLFPFEPPYFTKHGLKTTFMGHPLADLNLGSLDSKTFLKDNRIPANNPLLCVLPGSRKAEIEMHLPIFLDAIEILKIQFPNLEIVIPTLDDYKDIIKATMDVRGILGTIVTDQNQKYMAMKASTAALAASGTVTLELGLAQTPMIVAYKSNPITAFLVRRLLLTKHVSLVNILLEKDIVPELLQEDCKPETLSLKLHKLLKSGSECRELQMNELAKLQPLIEGPNTLSPSQIAANTIIETLTQKRS